MENKNRISTGMVIGIPTLGRPVSLEWALAFRGMSPPINFNVIYSIVKNQEVADARNNIAQFAIDSNSKYLFFLGDDVICPPHTLRQLLFRLENSDAGVVGGIYCSKSNPSAPLVFRGNGGGSYWDWKIGEYFECSGLGMDCTLIRVDVLKELSKPWFKTVDEDQFLDGENKAESWTEDLYFFNKLQKETQYKTYCDASVICKHVDIYNDKVYSLPKDSLPMRQMVTESDRKCLMIGPRINLNEPYNITHVNEETDDCDYRCAIDSLPFESKQFDFVVITNTEGLNPYKFPLEEWKRVCKDKLAIIIPLLVHAEGFATFLGGTQDGNYIIIEVQNGIGN